MEGRKNIFLDLDNTLIHSELYNPDMFSTFMKYDYDFIPPYVTVARPYLQTFLDYLFANHDVSIWTAATKPYATMIYDLFIQKYDHRRNVKYFLFDQHCAISREKTGCTKALNLLWEYWNLPGVTSTNTVIIDDLKEICQYQPNNCINVKPFTMVNGEDDHELLKVLNILNK